MAEDIRPGDVVVWDGTHCAVCADEHGHLEAPGSTKIGRPYRVTKVCDHPAFETPGVWLAGEDCGRWGRCICGFRKLNDDSEDAELIARIRACRPIERIDSPGLETLRVVNGRRAG